MNQEEREAHMRRMMAHGRKVQERARQDQSEFEEGCRRFFDFMRTARICEPIELDEPISTKRIWNDIHEQEKTHGDHGI